MARDDLTLVLEELRRIRESLEMQELYLHYALPPDADVEEPEDLLFFVRRQQALIRRLDPDPL